MYPLGNKDIRVKMIESRELREFEVCINKFLCEEVSELVDIKYRTIMTPVAPGSPNSALSHRAMIIYR